jgi:acetoin utilization deacetylase AcuC-like enzyme
LLKAAEIFLKIKPEGNDPKECWRSLREEHKYEIFNKLKESNEYLEQIFPQQFGGLRCLTHPFYLRSSTKEKEIIRPCVPSFSDGMKIVFHRDYCRVYSSDPAAAPDRLEAVLEELVDYEIVEPRPASEQDLELIHMREHISRVKSMGEVYEVALLAAGGAIMASEIAMSGKPAFGLIRPPGHHASPGSSWGFCYFNNIAISVERLRRLERIRRAVIVDVDLHYGDGTANAFTGNPDVTYHHVALGGGEVFLDDLASFLDSIRECDIIAVSAGFDRHVEDWGEMLETGDYCEAGKLIREFSERACGSRRYAVLEGGI